MGSHPDSKTRSPPVAKKKGRVVEDSRGHQIWQGTIRTVKLSLMKTGIFSMSESQRRLMKLGESGDDSAGDAPDENLEMIDDGGGFDPYDSAK